MAEETLFRVVSLAIIMLAIGGGFYYKEINDLQKDKEDIDQAKIKKQAKKPAVKYSVIVGVIYMVLVLAVAGLTG